MAFSSRRMPPRHQQYLLTRSVPVQRVRATKKEESNLPGFITTCYNDCETRIYIHDFSETVSDSIRQSNNFFEIRFLDFIKTHFRVQDQILDIGANIGNHTLFFAKFLDCRKVHAFEPFQTNFDVLKKNMEGYKDKCVCHKMAVSNKNGKLPLYNSQKENYGGFSLHTYSNGSSFVVCDNIDVKTIDSFNFENISMIKIDVENHENEVLEGARETILRNKPILFIENLHHGYPNVCAEPNPHKPILNDLGYVRKYANIEGSLMDLWVPQGQ